MQSTTNLTLVSLFLFITLTVAATLTPLAAYGPNANQFGDWGMWSAILTITILYALLLIPYRLGVLPMKHVMSIAAGFGIFFNAVMFFFMLSASSVLGVWSMTTVIFLTIAVCFICVNIYWYVVAYR
ncbi:DUF5391 family protein [Geomicrobium sp. JCM 19039]|uniref:DUF5391 family protein n=1 Tax=Geomicrobium sp. JCM 19039 TaxID=1460636 RepID=UPI00045F2F5D|nr:DUF5391 family protein [Geomicrobium sp. JCM 19039]GAK11998.1 hypothetical protein JCM19039_1725 [Geomicrobium sp. JCM 19039]